MAEKRTRKQRDSRASLRSDLLAMCRENRDGAARTQEDRRKGVLFLADEIHALGYRIETRRGLKTKHIEGVRDRLLARGVSAGRINNLMAHVRWWERKIGKPGLVPKTNEKFNLPRRVRSEIQKAWRASEDQLAKLPHDHMRASVLLMEHFGLRLEESIQIRPQSAIQGDNLELSGSWCKNGRPRSVPVKTAHQRALLEWVSEVACEGSLVPPDASSYKSYRDQVEYRTRIAGMSNLHGLRHGYAQRRFEEIAGYACPRNGGPIYSRGIARRVSKDWGDIRRAYAQCVWQDRAARLIVSQELGHGRIAIMREYIG